MFTIILFSKTTVFVRIILFVTIGNNNIVNRMYIGRVLRMYVFEYTAILFCIHLPKCYNIMINNTINTNSYRNRMYIMIIYIYYQNVWINHDNMIPMIWDLKNKWDVSVSVHRTRSVEYGPRTFFAPKRTLRLPVNQNNNNNNMWPSHSDPCCSDDHRILVYGPFSTRYTFIVDVSAFFAGVHIRKN